MSTPRITVEVTGSDPDLYATVVVALGADNEVRFTIHPSKVYPDTVNVEIDHETEESKPPRLRINVNDDLVFDSASVTAADDPAVAIQQLTPDAVLAAAREGQELGQVDGL